jgi:hypothetical protein
MTSGKEEKMLRFRFILFLAGVISFLTFSSTSFGANGLPISFSAEFTETSAGISGPTSTGMIYAGPDGMRTEGKFETEPYLMIINFKERMMWNIMPAEQLYFAVPFEPDSRNGEDEQSPFGFGVPCPDENAVATRIGSETLHGRLTEKWSCEIPGGFVDVVWFDPRLRVSIREESDDGTIFELRNIREEPLPAELFQPPAGFMKLEIPMMLFP